jgi:hypothetical protein
MTQQASGGVEFLCFGWWGEWGVGGVVAEEESAQAHRQPSIRCVI